MRKPEEYQDILNLWDAGFNKKQISEKTGIPRATVRDCITRFENIHNFEQWLQVDPRLSSAVVFERLCDQKNIMMRESYAYLLGVYLGDGELSRNRHIYRLRIALDIRYPAIIQACIEAIQTLLPENRVSLVDRGGCVNVSCYYKFWCDLFPQHDAGRKHRRSILLEDWQKSIISLFPLAFFKGLYHSDGSRFINQVNGRRYPRYQFTNNSEDIISLLTETCDQLGILWTKRVRQTGTIDVYISRRKNVEYLDHMIGPKQ